MNPIPFNSGVGISPRLAEHMIFQNELDQRFFSRWFNYRDVGINPSSSLALVAFKCDF